jgi:hypothetical protein
MKEMADYCHWCKKEIIRGSGYKNFQLGSRFCDDTCRDNYHNAKKRVERQKDAALRAIWAIEEMLTKQGELGQISLDAMRLIKKMSESTTLDCYCRNCGQTVWIIPNEGERCSFCQDSNWGFKPKRKNPERE